MANTSIPQAIQLRKSSVYTDSTTPTEANFETNSADLLDDMNNLRSAVRSRGGSTNWWDNFNDSAVNLRTQATLGTDLDTLETLPFLFNRLVLVDIAATTVVQILTNPGQTPTVGAAVATTTEGGVTTGSANFTSTRTTGTAVLAADLYSTGAPNTLRPLNLGAVFNGTTGDPITTTNGNQMKALLIYEGATDGAWGNTASGVPGDGTGNRGAIVFVEINATNDGYIYADATNLPASINYTYTQRNEFQNLNPWAFLNEPSADAVAGTDVTLTLAATNQSGTVTGYGAKDIDWEIPDNQHFQFQDDTGANILTMAVDGSNNRTIDIGVNASNDVTTIYGASLDINVTNDVTIQGGLVIEDGANPDIRIGQTISTIDNNTGILNVTGAGGMAMTATTGNYTVASTVGGIDLQAAGAVTIDSSGSSIAIGGDTDTGAINVGTGAAARTITVGNATGATAVDFDSGTGAFSFDSTVAGTTGATAMMTLTTSGTGGDSVGVFVGSASPNGVVTGSIGSLFLDGTNGSLWQNQNGSTTWTQFDAGATTSLEAAWAANTGVATTLLESFIGQVSDLESYLIRSDTGDHTLLSLAAVDTADVVTLGHSNESSVLALNSGLGGTTVDSTGAISIDAAAASNLSTSVGTMTVTAAAGATTVSGLAVNVTALAAALADDITLTGATPSGATNPGGDIILTSGGGNTTGAGGVLDFNAGAGGATGVGGAVTIDAGAGGATSGAGGAMTINAGTAATSGAGGALSVNAGAGAGVAGGGAAVVSSGDAGTTGSGGDFTVQAGDGGSTSGPAGRVDVRGGDSVDSTAGTVNLIGGDSTSSTAGHVNISAGDSGTGAGGEVRVTAGTGTASNGAVRLRTALDAAVSETDAIVSVENQGSGTGGGASVSFYAEASGGTGGTPTHSADSGSLYWQQSAGAAVLYMNTSTGASGTTWEQVQTGADAAVTLQNAYDGGNAIVTSGGDALDVSGTEAISLDAAGASNFTVVGANLTLETTGTANTVVSSDDWAMLGSTDTTGGAFSSGVVLVTEGVTALVPGTGFDGLAASTASAGIIMGTGTTTGNVASGGIFGVTGSVTGTSASGDITFDTGSSSNAASVSGIVRLRSGTGTGSSASGSVALTSGATSAGTSGVATLASGTASGGGDSGNVVVNSGTSFTGTTGSTTVSTGANASTTNDPTGALTLSTGATTNAAGGSSGAVSVITGTTASTFATGDVSIGTGAPTGLANSGSIAIATGVSLATGPTSGSGGVSLTTGDTVVGTASVAGSIVLQPGDSNVASGEGPFAGGNVTIIGGLNSGTGSTGRVRILGGENDGSGVGGGIEITAGSTFGGSGVAGSIDLTAGVGSGAGVHGSIGLRTADAASLTEEDPIYTLFNQGGGTGGGQDVEIFTGTSDPTGFTYNAEIASLFHRDSGSGELWLKDGAAAADWVRMATMDDITATDGLAEAINVQAGTAFVAGAFNTEWGLTNGQFLEIGDAANGGIFTVTGAAAGASTVAIANASTFDVDTTGAITMDSSAGGVSLQGAAASDLSTSAGTMTVTAAAGATTVSGLAVNVTALAATLADDITLTGATPSGAGNPGGDIILTSGDGNTGGAGGTITGTAGTGGATGAGGAVTFTGGGGGATSGAGGAVSLAGGVPVDGAGGAISAIAANGVGTNRAGGAVTINAGTATGTATGGTTTITSGESAVGDGNAGDLFLVAADGFDSAGEVFIAAGSSSGGGHGRVNISLVTGAAPGGTPTDADEVVRFVNGGTNGGSSSFFFTDQTPVSNILADPGSIAVREGGAASAVYIHTGAVANNTDWTQLASAAGSTLQSSYESGNTITTSGGEGDVTIDGTEDFIVGGSVTVNFDTTDAISLDAGAASNFTTSSGSITIDSAALLDVNAGASMDVDVTGTYDMLSSSTFSIAGTGASSVTATSGDLDLSTVTSGDVNVTSATSTTAAGSDVSLTSGGSSFVTGDGGALDLNTGSASGATGGGTGGAFTLDTGVGALGTAQAGPVVAGVGGSGTVTLGAGGAATGDGTVAQGSAAGDGGAWAVTAGAGGAGDAGVGVGLAGDGGQLTFTGGIGGAGAGTNTALEIAADAGAGASVSLIGGAGGAGQVGTVDAADAGEGGAITLVAGVAGVGAGTGANANGGNISLVPTIAGVGGTGTAIDGFVHINSASPSTGTVLRLDTGGTDGAVADLFVGSAFPTTGDNAKAGSLFLFNDGTNADTGGRLYLQVDADGGADDGDNWREVQTVPAVGARQFAQVVTNTPITGSGTEAAGTNLTQAKCSTGTMPTRQAGHVWATQTEIYFNGVMMMNTTGAGAGDTHDVDAATIGAPTVDIRLEAGAALGSGDVVTIVYYNV